MSSCLVVKDWGRERKYTSLSQSKILSKKSKCGGNHISWLAHFERKFLDIERYALHQAEDGTETALTASMGAILYIMG